MRWMRWSSYAADAVESIIAEGAIKAMTKFNRRAQGITRRGRMRIYEELFIVRPDATEEEVDPVIEQLKSVITQSGGTVDKAEKWGMRRLAYRVLKHNEGQYILLQFTAKAGYGEGNRTPLARCRSGDEVHHRAHRREAEAN